MAREVSNTWKEAVQAQFRYPAYLSFTFKTDPPGLQIGAEASCANTESLTDINTVIDGLESSVQPAASLELNRWIGNGSMYLLSENPSENSNMLWWSNKAPTIQVTFDFDQSYDVHGVYIYWDTETNSWPTIIMLYAFDANDNLIARGTYNNNSVESFINLEMPGVKRVSLRVSSWSKSNWRARISEVVFGNVITYKNTDRILEATKTAVNSKLNDNLTSASIDVVLDNQDQFFDPMLLTGVSSTLAKRQIAEIRWGFMTQSNFVEWMQPERLFLNTFNIPSQDKKVTFKLVSRFSFLNNLYDGGVYSTQVRSFYDVALEIFQNSNIIKSYTDEIPWVLPDSLKTIYTKAPIPEMPINSLLQLIAQASVHFLIIDPANDFIVFSTITSESGYTLTKMQHLGEPEVKLDTPLKKVIIGLYQYIPNNDSEVIYENTLQLSGQQTLTVSYKDDCLATDCIASVTGATLINASYKGRKATLQITAPVGGALVSISITGKIVTSNVTYIETYNDDTVDNGLTVTLENPFVTEVESITAISNAIVAYYTSRQKFKIDYLGYPELEASDQVGYQGDYGNATIHCEKATLNYNGGWSGTLEGRPI